MHMMEAWIRVLWQPRAAGMDVSSPETGERRQGVKVCDKVSVGPLQRLCMGQVLSSYTSTAQCSRTSADLHEEAAGRRHRPLLSPARTLEGITEGALPQHGSDQNLGHSQHRGQWSGWAARKKESLFLSLSVMSGAKTPTPGGWGFLTTAERLGTNLTEFWMSSSVTSTTEQCSSSRGSRSAPPWVTQWSIWAHKTQMSQRLTYRVYCSACQFYWGYSVVMLPL